MFASVTMAQNTKYLFVLLVLAKTPACRPNSGNYSATHKKHDAAGYCPNQLPALIDSRHLKQDTCSFHSSG